MKINSSKPPEGMDPGSIRKTSADKSAGQAGGGQGLSDNIEISRTGKEMQSLLGAIHGLPEVRTDKVNAISQSVKAGTYKVNSQNIAEKMISEMS